MGVCLSCCKKGNQDDNQQDEVHNATMTCKSGRKGKYVETQTKDGLIHVSGHGILLGSFVLECDSGYWEVKVGDIPKGVMIGVKRFSEKEPSSLDMSLDNEETAWILRGTDLSRDDIIGVLWDQTDFPMLQFSRNGEMLPTASISRVRPANNIYPAISLDQGSTCTVAFIEDQFKFPPSNKQKYKMIVGATSLI